MSHMDKTGNKIERVVENRSQFVYNFTSQANNFSNNSRFYITTDRNKTHRSISAVCRGPTRLTSHQYLIIHRLIINIT